MALFSRNECIKYYPYCFKHFTMLQNLAFSLWKCISEVLLCNRRCLYSQRCYFSSSHVRMWKLDHKEGWVLKSWWFQTMVLEKTPESPLGSREIKLVNPKGNQPWIFIGRMGAEAPKFGHLMQRADWLEKTLMLDKIEGREGDDGGWDGWMASPTQQIWVWATSERWWKTGKPGVL